LSRHEEKKSSEKRYRSTKLFYRTQCIGGGPTMGGIHAVLVKGKNITTKEQKQTTRTDRGD